MVQRSSHNQILVTYKVKITDMKQKYVWALYAVCK